MRDCLKFRRHARGSSIIELGFIGVIMSAMAVVCVNVGLLVFAAWMNDAACRDATRAAAQQSTAEDAQAAAILASKQFGADTSVIGHPVVLTGPAEFKYQNFHDADGMPDHKKGPRVTVTTRLNTKLPCPVIWNGTKLTDLIVFKQAYTYPILNPEYKEGEDSINDALATQEEDQLAADASAEDAASGE